MTRTLEYYKQNSENFIAGTVDVDFSIVADRFLEYLSPYSRILDFGCGSGRDTKYFLQKGYLVDAIDGSPELCTYAAEFTGIPVKCMMFQDLDEEERYDAIWACASILHVPKKDLADIFHKIIRALKSEGVIYTSFKYGDFEGTRNERHFTDFTSESFREFIKQFQELEIVEEWITSDARPGRSEEKWLNLILRK